MGRTGTSRGGLLVGALLIVLGAGALAVRETDLEIGWPAWVILPGLALLLVAFAIPEPGGSGLAVVGGIVTAVGAVLAVQDATGTYASWAYAWALVAPGGVGAGLLLHGALTRHGEVAWGGLASLITGIVLFLVGFLFFEGVLHLDGSRFGNLTDVTIPIVIMGIGAAILVGAFIPGPWRRRSWPASRPPWPTAWTAGGGTGPGVRAGQPGAGGAPAVGVLAAVVNLTTTCSPTCRSPEVTAVDFPSESPKVTGTAWSFPAGRA